MPSTITAVSFKSSLLSRRATLWLAAIAVAVSVVNCASLPPPRTPIEALYRKRCGNCHELAEPGAYSGNDWKRIMVQMSGNAGLSDAQAAELLGWLMKNSGSKTP